MDSVVKWGIVGAGDVCERKSGPPLYQVARSRLQRVYRRNRPAAEDFVARHGHGTVAESYATLLADPEVDAVYVATPHHLHAEHSIAALEAGKHVLVEKPMALSTTDCDRMIAAADAAGRALAVAYYRRGYPAVLEARRIVASGALGTVHRMAINAEFPTSHRIDLVHYILGPITDLSRDPDPDPAGFRFEQMMPRIHARTKEGAEVTLAEQWTETGMPEAFVIDGEHGRLHVTDLKGGRIVYNGREIETGSLPWTHWGLVENMVAHVLDGTSLLCDARAGRASTVVLERLG